MTSSPSALRAVDPWLLLAGTTAAVLPSLLAYNPPPSATLLNQCVAVAAWGLWLALLAPARLPRAAWPAALAGALMAGAVLVSWLWGSLPASLAWSALALLLAATAVLLAGADLVAGDAPGYTRATAVGGIFFLGLLVAGALSALVALVQVFAPGWADGRWIAVSGLPGRAVGNLRQPNHLCTLLLWGVVAAVVLRQLRWLPGAALWALVALLVFAVELSASRTGAIALVLLLAWGALDKRLDRSTRWCLVATPLLYGLAYGAMAVYGDWSQAALGAEARLDGSGLGDAGSPNSRLNVWRTAWALVLAQPWAGVGFGEFNFAWTLTAFPGRPVAFFDHTHNLPLQLAVELGLPLALVVLGLLAWAMWRALRAGWQAEADIGSVARGAWVLVAIAGLHSMVEYPLWYAYFLLPTAFALGLALGLVPSRAKAARSAGAIGPGRAAVRWGVLAGVLMLLGGALAVRDYHLVAAIYAPGDDDDPLLNRMLRGQRSVLFAHHADYAIATNTAPAAAKALAFSRVTHALLDTRLMVAWAHYLNGHGDTEHALWLTARLREFGHAQADGFFEACERTPAPQFPCAAPAQAHDWREFIAPLSTAAAAPTR